MLVRLSGVGGGRWCKEPTRVFLPRKDGMTTEEVTAKDLAGLLRTGRPDVRSAAAVLVAAQSADLAGIDAIYTSPDDSPSPAAELIGALLMVVGDTAKAVGRSSLSALINFSSDERACRMMVAAGAVAVCIQSLLDPSAENRSLDMLNSGLIANLTRFDFGCKSALALDKEENDQLLSALRVRALASRVSNEPAKENQLDPLESSAMFVGNATQISQGRDLLMSDNGAVLSMVVDWLKSFNRTRRLGAAISLRNCIADESTHSFIFSKLSIVHLLVKPFVDKSHLPPEDDLADAPEATKSLSSFDAEMEPEQEVRKALAESLLLLCKLRRGREAIRRSRVYPFLREHHAAENEEPIQEIIEEVVQRTELVDEDAETSKDNLEALD